jgi:hypothetical protein
MKNMMGDAVELYFKKWGGCDYKITDVGSIEIGIEPAYMYEDVKIIHICKHNKNFSHILTGIAWGAYGSDWATTRKYYGDYKYKSKFVKFIDRWHDKIF